MRTYSVKEVRRGKQRVTMIYYTTINKKKIYQVKNSMVSWISFKLNLAQLKYSISSFFPFSFYTGLWKSGEMFVPRAPVLFLHVQGHILCWAVLPSVFSMYRSGPNNESTEWQAPHRNLTSLQTNSAPEIGPRPCSSYVSDTVSDPWRYQQNTNPRVPIADAPQTRDAWVPMSPNESDGDKTWIIHYHLWWFFMPGSHKRSFCFFTSQKTSSYQTFAISSFNQTLRRTHFIKLC